MTNNFDNIRCPDCGGFAWYEAANCLVCDDCGCTFSHVDSGSPAREQHVTAHEAARVLAKRGDGDDRPMMLEDEFGVIDLPGDE